MKMGPGTFWGLLLILIGTALILKVVLKIDIPVYKMVISIFFIVLGLKILFGNFKYHKFMNSGSDVVFGELYIKGSDLNKPEYNIVFGKGEFDLRDLNLNETGTKYVKITSVFGGTDIHLNKDTPVKITTESAFSGGKLPDGNSTAFGTSTYISQNYDPLKPHLNLRVELVFSGVNVKN